MQNLSNENEFDLNENFYMNGFARITKQLENGLLLPLVKEIYNYVVEGRCRQNQGSNKAVV